MNIDILEQLIPNVLTMITQLIATGVIFIMYTKFLHNPVMEYLNARQSKKDEDIAYANLVKDEARDLQYKTKKDYETAQKELSSLREKMLSDAEKEKEKLLSNAMLDVKEMKKRNDQVLKDEKQRLYEEVNSHILEIANDINQKVLSDYSVSQDEMISSIKKEIAESNHQNS